MPLNPLDWHDRFTLQAQWTKDLRHFLFKRAELASARRLLEVGCGSGVILAELSGVSTAALHGLDIAREYLGLARSFISSNSDVTPKTPIALVQGDGHQLPYATHSFDLVYCHYLLLWTADPLQVIKEMRRVCLPGGSVITMAEPDYGGRIDHPQELAQLAEWQEASLRRQGADPRTGRRLGELFAAAGLQDVEVGVLGGQWNAPPKRSEWESEWSVIRADLEGFVNEREIQRLKRWMKRPVQSMVGYYLSQPSTPGEKSPFRFFGFYRRPDKFRQQPNLSRYPYLYLPVNDAHGIGRYIDNSR